MSTAGSELKSPIVPLFQRGNFLREASNPSLEKRGRGDFSRSRNEFGSCPFVLSKIEGL